MEIPRQISREWDEQGTWAQSPSSTFPTWTSPDLRMPLWTVELAVGVAEACHCWRPGPPAPFWASALLPEPPGPLSPRVHSQQTVNAHLPSTGLLLKSPVLNLPCGALGWAGGQIKTIPKPNTAHKVPRGLQVPKGRSGGFPGARNTPQEMWQESILPQAPSPPGSPQACSLYLSRP